MRAAAMPPAPEALEVLAHLTIRILEHMEDLLLKKAVVSTPETLLVTLAVYFSTIADTTYIGRTERQRVWLEQLQVWRRSR